MTSVVHLWRAGGELWCEHWATLPRWVLDAEMVSVEATPTCLGCVVARGRR